MTFIRKPESQMRSKNLSINSQGRLINGKFRRGGPIRKKVCRFCADKLEMDYKNVSLLRVFTTEKGKILSGRITGTCAKHQRKLDRSIKRARMIALLPFTVN
ncbi:MAG: 30S ribosomal protein S18 [Endomicrobiia bacterium]|nr:MAG: 30S ribosomal protein S18 [Endomicrobiia bacterium]